MADRGDDRMDERSARNIMRELGVRLEDAARKTDIDMSYVGKQVRGDRPMSRAVREALGDLFQAKAIVCLPYTALLLRDHDEPEAAEACERLWAVLRAVPAE